MTQVFITLKTIGIIIRGYSVHRRSLLLPIRRKKKPRCTDDDKLGTWRIVLLAEPDTYLSLCSFSVDYSTRIFVNGQEVRNIGFVSDDPDEAVPMIRYMTLPLYSGSDGRIEIVYQYANYIHNQGGFIFQTVGKNHRL